ncbi:release factor H-coupled R [Auricularia subglabra TFB-10046 SS5]|nr:release factor H-coupled R [Auricularia subglabra TFB-10046 SS5]
MGSRALALTLNANHSKRSTILLSTDAPDVQSRILREARNKFRSKALSQVFLQGGLLLGPDDDLPLGVSQVWVGKGEPYTGPPSPATSQGAKGEVRVLAREAYVDDGAVKQLDAVAAAPGVLHAVGMPDLHPGSRFPIGCAIAATGVYPALVGSDIGCGVALYFLAPRRKSSPVRLAARLIGLDAPWDGDRRAWLATYGVHADVDTSFDIDLGTVGAGNHFAELCDVEALLEPVSSHPELTEGALCLLVHSGSRGLGASILAQQTAGGNANPLLEPGTSACHAYLEQHDTAVRWARANRDLIAHRVRACLMGADKQDVEHESALRKITDVTHNSVEPCTLGGVQLWVHRKGAAPTTTESGLVPCPGSRGAFSYLLSSVGDGERNAHSLAHGAGRRHPRTRMHEGSPAVPSRTTALGGEVVCEDRALMLEERPEAYKDINGVVRDMEQLGMARPVVKLRPVVSYKVREGARGTA